MAAMTNLVRSTTLGLIASQIVAVRDCLPSLMHRLPCLLVGRSHRHGQHGPRRTWRVTPGVMRAAKRPAAAGEQLFWSCFRLRPSLGAVRIG